MTFHFRPETETKTKTATYFRPQTKTKLSNSSNNMRQSNVNTQMMQHKYKITKILDTKATAMKANINVVNS